MLLRATLAIVLTLGLAAAACGGDDGGGATPVPGTTVVPGFTPQPVGLLTPGPPPPIDPNMPLTEYVAQDRSPKFAISHPADWRMEQGPSDVKWLFDTADRGNIAVFGVTCIGEESPEAAVESSARLLDRVGVPWQPYQAQQLQIDGRHALLWPYTITMGTGEINQVVYYVQGTRCVWELRAVIFALRPYDQMARLFQRMAETFREIEG